VGQRQQHDADGEAVEVQHLEQAEQGTRLHELFFVPAVVVDDRCGIEAHLRKEEASIRDPESEGIEEKTPDDHLQQAIACPFAGDDETHSVVLRQKDLVDRQRAADAAKHSAAAQCGAGDAGNVAAESQIVGE